MTNVVRIRDYIEPKVPYIPMRLMCGLMGVAVVPMAFYTVRNSGHSLYASTLAALLVLFGNVSGRKAHAQLEVACPA